MGFGINYCIRTVVFLVAAWLSLGNATDRVLRTRRQLNALHRTDKDLRRTFVHQIFESSPPNNSLFHQIGKALADKNDEFNGLKSSNIEYVDAYLDVVNKALDENVNSVINLTVIIRASKLKKVNIPSNVDSHPKDTSIIRPTQTLINDRKLQDEGKLSTFEKAVLDAHNSYRQIHRVPPLTFSAAISKVSQEWANYLAENDRFEHRQKSQYGENIYAVQSSDSKFKVTGQMPVDTWYAEIKNYTFNQEPDMNTIMKTGHFTQLVWKTSAELGVGLAQSKGTSMYYVVCNYNPRGNWVGEFRANVNPPMRARS